MSEQKVYKCVCGQTFDKYQQMSAHKAGCKDYLQSTGKQFDFICQNCGRVFGNYGALGAHTKFKHQLYKPKEKQRVQCPFCNRQIVKTT